MAWAKVEIVYNGETYLGHQRDTDFAIRFESGLSVGEKFQAGGKTYQALSVDNEANRDEIFNVKAAEVKDDKPKTRRTKPKSGRSDVSMQSVDGHDNAD
jgi:hypothetical protein